MTISELKLDLISIISTINDIEVLKSIKNRLKSNQASQEQTSFLPFEQGITPIRKQITKEDIFKEQGNKSITFDEVKQITHDTEWEVSLHELLESLN